MKDEPKISIDMEGGEGLKPDKVLMVGKDQTDTASLLKAVKEHPEAKIIVVDSYSEEPKLDMNKVMAYAALSGWMGPALDCLERKYRRKPKEISKCGLPGCEKMGVKDYCCAEHCREHRARQKGGV